MRDARALLRLTAVVLVAVLALTLAAPARAEAIDPMTWVAIAGAAVVVIIIIAYIIVASSKGPRMPDAQDDGPRPVMVACAEAEGQPRTCWAVDRPAERVNPAEIVPVSEPVTLDSLTLAPQS